MTEPSFVYIVMGDTGEYSDRTEWPVLAFPSEEAAAGLVVKCEDFCREHGILNGDDKIHLSYSARANIKNPHDENMYVDYTGVRYYVMPVRLA